MHPGIPPCIEDATLRRVPTYTPRGHHSAQSTPRSCTTVTPLSVTYRSVTLRVSAVTGLSRCTREVYCSRDGTGSGVPRDVQQGRYAGRYTTQGIAGRSTLRRGASPAHGRRSRTVLNVSPTPRREGRTVLNVSPTPRGGGNVSPNPAGKGRKPC